MKRSHLARISAALASIQIGVAACIHPALSETERAHLQRIALETPTTEPEVSLGPITSGRTEGALQGAVPGGLGAASAAVDGGCADPLCGSALMFASVVVLGAAIGAGVSPSGDKVDAAQQILEARVASVALQEQMNHFAREQLSSDPALILVDDAPDARFSLTLLSIRTVGGWMNAPVALRIEVESRLVTVDEETLISASYVGHTPSRKYVQWSQDRGEALARAIAVTIEELAERAIDDAFRVAYASGSPTVGGAGFLLSPIHPPSRGCFLCTEGRTLGNREWERVSSGETFAWQSFAERWSASRDEPVFGKLEDFNYDFRIYRAAPGSRDMWIADEIVYERRGLTEPSHRPDVELRACTRHFWSVRTRFRAGGRTRVSEWTGPHVDEFSAAVSRKPGRFWGTVGLIASTRFSQPPSAIMNLGHWGYPFISPPPQGASECASILASAP